ncbi:MAG: helix-turn-helix domain-containing protein [Chryseolinea sp.]
MKYLTESNKGISRHVILHFLPYIFLVCVYIFSFHTVGTSIEENDLASNDDKLVELIILTLLFIQVSAYVISCVRMLEKHRYRVQFFVSNLPGNDFKWLSNCVVGLCVLVAVLLLEVIFDQTHIVFLASPCYLAGFYYIGIQLAKQKDVLPSSQKTSEDLTSWIDLQQKQPIPVAVMTQNLVPFFSNTNQAIIPAGRKQVLSNDRLNELKIQLLSLMELKQPFLDSDLSLLKLGDMLQLDSYKTSYLINNCFNENFYVFINRYRLEACKKMLIDPGYNHLSILGIALEAGFNSKTAFNTSFKKYTGLSPKAYRDQNLPPASERGSNASTA